MSLIKNCFRAYCIYLLGLLLVLLQACASSADVNTEFPVVQDEFSAYVDDARTHIKRFTMRQRNREDGVYNLPFEISANPAAVYRGRFLLIHGLNDSPYSWRDLGASLADMGFDVRAILLPGHGTTPEALLQVHYSQWLNSARQHIDVWQKTTSQNGLSQQDSPIYLGGFSLGGVLATILALENDDIAGLLLVSPAWHSKLNRLLRWSGIYKLYKPWVFGGMILEDNPAKYNSIPVNSAAQYYNTTRYLKKRWQRHRLSIPVLVLASADDSVIDVSYMRSLYRKRFDGESRAMVIFSNDTSLTLAETEVRRPSARLDLRIINQSHMSLINSPDNELYGRSRKILVCNGNVPEIFFGCLRSPVHWYGAQHTVSPDDVAVARTTYNPDYEYVLQMIEQVFITGSGIKAEEPVIENSFFIK